MPERAHLRLDSRIIDRRRFLQISGLVATSAVVSPSLRDIFSTKELETTAMTPIHVSNGKFYNQGKPIRLLGENWYSLAEENTAANNQICGPILIDSQRQQWIKNVKSLGMNVIRYWDFPELTADGQGTQTVDQVVKLASQHGIWVYPTFENEFAACDGDTAIKTTQWYLDGYKQTYLPYVLEMTKKYKGDPRIFAFQLMNEAQCDNPEVLRNFFYDVLNAIKEIDPHRLVTPGILGIDQPGVYNHYRKIFTRRSPSDHRFDFQDIHPWPGSEHGSYKDLPGNPSTGLYDRLQIAEEMRMPLLLSEFGRERRNGMTDRQAAVLNRREIENLVDYPSFGGLIGWDLTPPNISTDSFSYDVHSYQAQSLRRLASLIKHPR